MCHVWQEKSPIHECNLPKNKEWSIHGLWPSKNQSWGPVFCDKSTKFVLEDLDSIRSELDVKWVDVFKGNKLGNLWKHEWSKHGTCALNISSINSQLEYFQAGLKLFKKHNLKEILEKVEIRPGNKYDYDDLLSGLKKGLRQDAILVCRKNKVINY